MEIIQMLCPSSKWSLKAPYAMAPQGITIHNTANDASAKNEVSYMITNSSSTSFHYAVDDVRAVQGIPLDRNAWHAGDGRNGFGNRYTIGIEICYSKSGGDRFHAAERNAAELTARLMLQYGWGLNTIGTKVINTHQYRSGKYCPHRTLDEGINRFWNMVREKYAQLSGTSVPTPTPTPTPNPSNSYLVKVTTGALNIRAGAGTQYPITGQIRDKGTYTIIETQGNWGKLKSGTGWICLDYTSKVGGSNTPSQPAPEKPKGHYVGEVVTINGVYASSGSSKKLTPAVKTGTITKILNGAANPYLLNNGNIGWVNDSVIVGSQGGSAPSGVTKTVNAKSGLNVRAGAGTNYKILKALPNGTKVTVYETSNGWSRIGNGQWVSSQYLR